MSAQKLDKDQQSDPNETTIDDILNVGLKALNKTTTPEHLALNYIKRDICHRESMRSFLAIYKNQIEFIRAYCPAKTILATNDQILESLVIYHLKVYFRTAIAPKTDWRKLAQMVIKTIGKN
jgi:hypothetical protein